MSPGGHLCPNNPANAVTTARASGKKKKKRKRAEASSPKSPATRSPNCLQIASSPKSPATRSPNSSRIASHQTPENATKRKVSSRCKSPSVVTVGNAFNDFQSKLYTASETYVNPIILGKRLAGLAQSLLGNDKDKIQATGETMCEELGIDAVTESTKGESAETAGPSTAHLNPHQSKKRASKAIKVPLLRKNQQKNEPTRPDAGRK